MKPSITILLAMSALAPAILAADKVTMPQVNGASITRQGNFLQVQINIPLHQMTVGSNTAAVITPRLSNLNDSINLSSIGIYGRNRYIYYQRNEFSASQARADQMYTTAQAPATYAYQALIPWQDWMDGSTLSIERTDYGCCSNIIGRDLLTLSTFEMPRPFQPHFQFIRPNAEAVKSRSVTGRAFIDFPVNRTEIYPDYRRNTTELAKIRATIDSVAGDPDITVRSISIKGYASPEGSYANNTRLAKGRTEALKDYVIRLYNFSPTLFHTSFEPEDWQGLRNWLSTATIDNSQAILAIADNESIEPDARDRKIRTDYPQQYSYILQNVYPALRHSDYTIDFDIRSFTDVNEIKRLVRTEPQKLSLNEFYLAAQSCQPGSDEFNQIFETAVRMYPDSEIANLNAANTAMQRRDLSTAASYLAKAGDSPEAIYARGILAALQGDNDRALDYLRQAARLHISDAPEAISQIERIQRLSGQQN